ncbi:MAG: hypothetical protein HYS25_01060 [Ignavibacteriales bacterium]|nr:hypothetical protein [Ignavibacteriales bacterium]
MNEAVNSAVQFLSTYGNAILDRKDKIRILTEKVNKLKPSVEEYNRLKGEIASLNADNKREEKFLLNMKNMLEMHTDAKVSIGDPSLFDQSKKPEEQLEKE